MLVGRVKMKIIVRIIKRHKALLISPGIIVIVLYFFIGIPKFGEKLENVMSAGLSFSSIITAIFIGLISFFLSLRNIEFIKDNNIDLKEIEVLLIGCISFLIVSVISFISIIFGLVNLIKLIWLYFLSLGILSMFTLFKEMFIFVSWQLNNSEDNNKIDHH